VERDAPDPPENSLKPPKVASKASGISEHAPSAEPANWAVEMDFDLTHPSPPAGRYDARIEGLELKRYTTVFLCLCYRIPYQGRDHYVWEELAIDAPRNSSAFARTAEGKSRIHEILTAFGEKPPTKIFAPDLEDVLVGREVHISVRSKQSGTFAVPVVTAVLGKARDSVPPPIE
jgi:hypothetical protein